MKELKLWTVGSISRDDIKTRDDERTDVLGGSVPYSAMSASFFTKTGAVGVVGSDFPAAFERRWQNFNVDTSGIRRMDGRTFRWGCVYSDNMIDRKTLFTELGVFANFKPTIPASFREAPFVLLGNIQPELQLAVLDQARNAEFVLVDTMDYWIKNKPAELRKVIKRATMLTLNDTEARLLVGKWNLLECAASLIQMGPRYVLIKKGEHGAMLFTEDDIFIVPAYPVRRLTDPTGAGDAYAGAFMGYLAHAGEVKDRNIHNALLHASVVASFAVEEFGPERFTRLTLFDIKSRVADLKHMVKI